MISVIVLHGLSPYASGRRPGALVRTLTPLVGFAIRGLVRDVGLVAVQDDVVQRVADEAGCTLFDATDAGNALSAAVAAARQPDVLMMISGFVPELGFREEIDDFLAVGQGARLMRRAPMRFVEKLWTRAAPVAGLLVRDLLTVYQPGEDFAQLTRRLKPPAMRTRGRLVV